MINNERADSIKVDRYLVMLESKDLAGFADNFSPGDGAHVVVEFRSGSAPHAVIRGWKQAGNKWILHSQLQPGVYFEDSLLSQQIFPGKQALLTEGQ